MSSRPQTRLATRCVLSRSVTVGLVLAGETIARSDLAYTSDEGIATPEFKWPTTARIDASLTMFWAFATPTSGVAWSSKGTYSTVKPMSSRGFLSWATASLAPFSMAVPRTACGPESGLWEAILMVPPAALAVPTPAKFCISSATTATSTTTFNDFIYLTPYRNVLNFRTQWIVHANISRGHALIKCACPQPSAQTRLDFRNIAALQTGQTVYANAPEC